MATPPTTKQLRYLRALAVRTGTTFSPPKTARDASRAIDGLKHRPVSPWHERNADAVSIAEQRGAHNGTDVGGHEVAGYGANAHWAGR
jgi:hypothetical protein